MLQRGDRCRLSAFVPNVRSSRATVPVCDPGSKVSSATDLPLLARDSDEQQRALTGSPRRSTRCRKADGRLTNAKLSRQRALRLDRRRAGEMLVWKRLLFVRRHSKRCSRSVCSGRWAACGPSRPAPPRRPAASAPPRPVVSGCPTSGSSAGVAGLTCRWAAAAGFWLPVSASPHLPADRSQPFIKVFDGRVSSSSLRAVSMPATGRPLGSSLPICTSTLAWSQ
jgi:hypothetical protein